MAGGVAKDDNSCSMIRKSLEKFFTGLLGSSMSQDDFVQHINHPAVELRDYGTHGINIEVERPKKGKLPIWTAAGKVCLAMKRGVDSPSVHAEVFAKDLLAIEALVIAAFQAFVKIGRLFKEMSV